jgi:uncharacterized protein YkwD
MKKRTLGMIAALLAFVVMICAGAYAADAQTTEIQFSPTFGQSEARSMLSMINEFRTGDEAFCWNEDDTAQVSYKGEPLAYSYALEEIAMQRAAETALSFSHTRPDGTRCFTAVASDGTRSWGENIAVGSSTAGGAFKQWREDDDDYSGQGHRRNMLSQRFCAVGIGHVTLNGVHYWVQEFSDSLDGAPETAPLDAERLTAVDVSSARIESVGEITLAQSEITLQKGESVALPAASASVQLADAWPGGATVVNVSPVWTSGNASVCAVEGQEASGAAAGAATLTGAALGKTVSLSVKVGGGDPLPVAYGIIDAEPWNGELSVTLTNPGAATLIAAYFDADGKFLSAELQSVRPDADTVALGLSAGAETARVMLLDGDSRPLCAAFAAAL